MDQQVCFVGHTHTLEMVSITGRGIFRSDFGAELVSLDEDSRYIISAGSVGQPRDGNTDAKYVIWDSSKNTLLPRFISYDIAAAAKKIIQLGFPEINASRLW